MNRPHIHSPPRTTLNLFLLPACPGFRHGYCSDTGTLNHLRDVSLNLLLGTVVTDVWHYNVRMQGETRRSIIYIGPGYNIKYLKAWSI